MTGTLYLNQPREIICSSNSGNSYLAKWYFRQTNPEDPWVSLKDHPEGVLYAENGTPYHTQLLSSRHGANVYIGKKGHVLNYCGSKG